MAVVYRFLLTPRWLALHAATLALVVACSWLGWWQLGRAQYREPAPVRAAEPVPLDTVLAPGELVGPDDAGRVVAVAGTYDAAREVLVPGRKLTGRTGFAVVTPLVTETGWAVAVERGWIPTEAAAGAPSTPRGQVRVTGRLTPSENPPRDGLAGSGLPAGQVPRISTSILVNEWPHELYDGYVALEAQVPPPSAAGPQLIPAPEDAGETRWSLQNLAYWLQWWVFAGAALLMWLLMVRREILQSRQPGDGRDTSPVREQVKGSP